MKKIVSLILILCIMFSFTACGKNENEVVIYSSSEGYRNEYIMKRLNEEFPQYNIILQYQSTGNSAAKIKTEGKDVECDIVLELESSYMEMLKDNFATLDDYDFTKYTDDMVVKDKKYATWYRISGGIIINKDVLAKKGLDVPKTYEDLLDPKYKNLIAMPNPKASSTGYMFLKALVNSMGEDKGFEYFDKLSENILQFTSSGSGPVNMLLQDEIAIGLGITYQAVNEINSGSTKLEINFFDEGAPYSTGGMAIIDGRQNKQAVKDVFSFIFNTLSNEDKEKYAPETIYKNQKNNIDNYPKDIKYADMTGINDINEKQRLLAKWKY